MMISLNYIINLLNLFLIFTYFILLNFELIEQEIEYLLVFFILINFIIKLYVWYNFNTSKKQNLHIIFSNIFTDDRFTKLIIFILSIATPIYMILQRESLVIDLFIEKLSFILVFIFSLIGFYLEFFILESKFKK